MDIGQTRGLILFLCGIFDLFFTFVFWRKAKESRVAFHLGFVTFFSCLYAFAYAMIFLPESDKLFWSRLTWVAVLITSAYVGFVRVFTERLKNFKIVSFVWYVVGAIFVLIAIATPYITASTSFDYPYEDKVGPLAPAARIYILAGLSMSIFYLLAHYFKSDRLKKIQLQYFILGMFIYTFGGIIAGGIIPLISPSSPLIDISVWTAVPWISLTAYAIVRKQLFDIKIFLTEMLVYSFGSIMLIQIIFRIFPDSIFAQWFNFIVFCFIGYLLIKANRREIQRGEVLEEKVAKRTKELQSAYQRSKQNEEELTKFYNLTVGREVRMAELKEKIKELEEK